MSHPAATPYLGLAPFLRRSIAGQDLRPLAQDLLAQANADQDDANLWMNLATAFFAIGQRPLGLSMQEQALLLQRTYRIPANGAPRLRLLVLTVAGDIAENTPIDCLLEGGDIELVFYYASPEQPLPAEIPPHDVLLVAICEDAANRPLLNMLSSLLENWPQPLLNRPGHIINTERSRASQLLQGIPGLLMPPTGEVAAADLLAVVRGEKTLAELLAGADFPVILRPVGAHGGHGLARISDRDELGAYLAAAQAADFYLSPFIDYSGSDGLFRKYRVALIDGEPFACHMAISAHWMIHYLNAGMYQDAGKRAEEASFMCNFAAFVARHGEALEAIYRRAQLDYVCIDCAETRSGDLLIFEIDHAMVVHAMDPEDLFPYKQTHMKKVRWALEGYLLRLARQAKVQAQ